MRKHLYRAFRKDSSTQTLCGNSEILVNGQKVCGEWVYGYLASSHFIDEYEEPVFDGITIEMFKERHNVIPETICEYTSLTDKNGKKIFEGDIVRFAEWSKGDMCWVGEIFFECTMFQVKGGPNKECKSNFITQLSRISSERMEIIGNIYDNPELLER